MPDRDRREELQESVERAVLSKGEATCLPNPHEIAAVAGFANELPNQSGIGPLVWATALTCCPGESWLHIRFEPKPPYEVGLPGVEGIDLALWRFSLDIYGVQEDGSVTDDPLTPETFARRFR